MDQTQIINNQVDDDLQKAIDNITNTTNIDPVFSDPIAAPSSVPEGDTGELDEPVGPFPDPEISLPPEMPEPIAPLDIAASIPTLTPPAPAPMPAPEDIAPAAPAFTPIAAPVTSLAGSDNLNMHQVKEAALRDLVPLLDRLNMTASQKFNIYRNIFENLRDYTVLSRAYTAAKEIINETERAEALLYLVESIDRM